MLDVQEIKGSIAKCGLSQRRVANLLGITEKTFYLKMKAGVFRTDELEQIAEILGISDIGILFRRVNITGTSNVTTVKEAQA